MQRFIMNGLLTLKNLVDEGMAHTPRLFVIATGGYSLELHDAKRGLEDQKDVISGR